MVEFDIVWHLAGYQPMRCTNSGHEVTLAGFEGCQALLINIKYVGIPLQGMMSRTRIEIMLSSDIQHGGSC